MERIEKITLLGSRRVTAEKGREVMEAFLRTNETLSDSEKLFVEACIEDTHK